MTPKAGAPQAKHSGKIDRARRKLVKLIAAAGAGAIAGAGGASLLQAASPSERARASVAARKPTPTWAER